MSESLIGTTHIVINGRITLDVDALDAVGPDLVAMQEASRAEDGCLDYTFSIDAGDPKVVCITERWTTKEALLAHFAAPHMATFQAAIGAQNIVDRNVSFFEATETAVPS